MDLFEYFTTDNISGKKCTEKWLSKNNNSLYNEIIEWTDKNDLSGITFKEKTYLFSNNIKVLPVCYNCNAKIKYWNFRLGYHKYCSAKCVKESDCYYNKWLESMKKTFVSANEKRLKTNIEAYGSKEAYQNHIYGKGLETSRSKNGGLLYVQTEEFKEKRKISLLKKYGDSKYNNKEKTKSTRIENNTQVCDELLGDYHNYKKLAINRTETIYRHYNDHINVDNKERAFRKYHLDHRFSLKQSYLCNLPLEIVSHPANMKIVWWRDNICKQDKCDITLIELFQAIIDYKHDIIVNFSSISESYKNIKQVAQNLLNNYLNNTKNDCKS